MEVRPELTLAEGQYDVIIYVNVNYYDESINRPPVTVIYYQFNYERGCEVDLAATDQNFYTFAQTLQTDYQVEIGGE